MFSPKHQYKYEFLLDNYGEKMAYARLYLMQNDDGTQALKELREAGVSIVTFPGGTEEEERGKVHSFGTFESRRLPELRVGRKSYKGLPQIRGFIAGSKPPRLRQ